MSDLSWPRGPSKEVCAAGRIVEVLVHRASLQPDDIAYSFLGEDDQLAASLTYGQLFEDASRVATRVLMHASPGDRAILLFASGLEFIKAFFGCQIAGVIPVPVMPPRQVTASEAGRVISIVGDADAKVVLTTTEILSVAQGFLGAHPTLSALLWITADELDGLALTPACSVEDAGPLALLQYTSGSTSRPRGVMVGHDNLMHNLGDIYWTEQNHEETVSVSWLPMSHDMGLIEGVLQPLYSGHRAYLMSPAQFMARPLRWLEAISTYGATVSGGPNFAYDLVLRRLGDGDLPPYRFSQWQFAYNGSEPVSLQTMERFARRMAPCGFAPHAFAPMFGMAEATLGVTDGRRGKGLRSQSRVGVGGERVVVSLGSPAPPTRVVVVDPQSTGRVADGEEGEIWVRGPSVTRGYWRLPEQTEAIFGATIQGEGQDRWLRTGDLGFALDGELYISGRSKEVIVCRGQNIYPQDLEVTAERAHALIRPGGAVAFRVQRRADEAALLVAEVDRAALKRGLTPAQLKDVARIVRRRVASTHAVPVEDVLLVKPGTVPRTTSGKRQRLMVRRMHENGRLEPLATATSPTPHDDASNNAGLLPRVAAILGVDPETLDHTKTLAQLGLDSLDAVELLMELDEIPEYAEVDLVQLLTLELGQLLSYVSHPMQNQPQQRPWRDDATLEDETIPTPGGPLEGTSVLLTGATGFLGSHVAIELLTRSDATVRCVVRGEDAHQRLHATLSEHPDWRSSWADRVQVLNGDLEQPELGLTAEQFTSIAADTRAVYHCAAMVNWVYPYAALRQANVEGTRALIRFACQARASLTYVSTLATCWSSQPQDSVNETSDPVDHLDGVHLDYVRSKAVAESLVRQAGARGLPVSILRPGLIFSHARTKAHTPGDFLSALCKGCIDMQCAPDLEWDMEVCTVDEVARWVVDLEPTTGAQITALHLGAAKRRLWRGMVLWMNLRGYPVKLLPYDAWCDALKAYVQEPAAALRGLYGFFWRPVRACNGLRLPQVYESTRKNPIDSTHSNALLAATPRARFDAVHLEATFDHLVRLGYLPAAPSVATSRQDEALWNQELEALLHESLRTRHDGVEIKALRAQKVTSNEDGQSIVSELASWRFGKTTGVHRFTVTYEQGGNQETLDVALKAQVEDVHAIEVSQDVASLCGPDLGQAWGAHRTHHEMWRSHVREGALYRMEDPRLRAHTPTLYGSRPGMLLLEDISAFPMLQDPWSWEASHIEAAVTGMARIHAIGYGDPSPIGETRWWAPPRTGESLVAQEPLWRALLEFGLTRPIGQLLGEAGRARTRVLLEEVSEWARAMDEHPHAMIHGDCNPRNMAFRPDGTLCVFDWELARRGLPQRDLAELLCFTLGDDVDAQMLDGWLTMHREQLQEHTLCAIDPVTWREGFRLALSDFMLTRLTAYTMLDYVYPQPFLKRVVSTWARLDALCDPSGDLV